MFSSWEIPGIPQGYLVFEMLSQGYGTTIQNDFSKVIPKVSYHKTPKVVRGVGFADELEP